MNAVCSEIVVKVGSNITLTCLGHKVEKIDTRIIWKFNATRYKGIPRRKMLKSSWTKKEETFLCTLKRSEKDVGNYTCLAKVSAGRSKHAR